jgi:hypothetical protein
VADDISESGMTDLEGVGLILVAILVVTVLFR